MRRSIESVEIREATLDDVEAIRRMHAKSWLDTYPNDEHDISREWLKVKTDAWLTREGLDGSQQHFRSVLSDPQQFYRVAVDNGKIIGFVHGLNTETIKELAALYIAKAYQGSGLAQQLAVQIDEWFGDDIVELDVVSYNARAIRFYENWGFAKVPNSESLFQDKLPTFRMRREAK